jgi:hypothetical protein
LEKGWKVIAAVRDPSKMKIEGEVMVVKLEVGEKEDAKKVSPPSPPSLGTRFSLSFSKKRCGTGLIPRRSRRSRNKGSKGSMSLLPMPLSTWDVGLDLKISM